MALSCKYFPNSGQNPFPTYAAKTPTYYLALFF